MDNFDMGYLIFHVTYRIFIVEDMVIVPLLFLFFCFFRLNTHIKNIITSHIFKSKFKLYTNLGFTF